MISERGQAAVEAALTLPLTLFMIVGTLQLFMMFQARLMTEHAAFVANRVGALAQGNCERMKHAAILTLLPTFARTNSRARVVDAFAARQNNNFRPALDQGEAGAVVWMRTRLENPDGRAAREDPTFDDPDRTRGLLRLETTLTFWFPLRIPFANWIIARSVLAAWGLKPYTAANPLMPTQGTSDWSDPLRPGAPAAVSAAVQNEFRGRCATGHLVFPIQATASMRMMSSPRFGVGYLNNATGGAWCR